MKQFESVKRLLVYGVAAITLTAGLTGPAHAVPTPSSSQSVSTSTSTSSVDLLLRDRIVGKIKSERSTMGVGETRTIHQASGVQLVLSQRAAGEFQLVATDGATSRVQRGFCHAAAMAAVYAIGAAAFAAAALVGGITVVGVAISAEAAQALSISLAAGSGVSALVSAYIC